MVNQSYLFLDVDGVLNSHAWFRNFNEEHGRNACINRGLNKPSEHIDPEAVARLNCLTKVTGAKIVVSSTWRTARTVHQLQALLEYSGFTGEVVGKTGHGFNGDRDRQILQWIELTGNEKSNFVVIDDEKSDLGDVIGRLVQTDGKVGLTDKDIDKAIQMLELEE